MAIELSVEKSQLPDLKQENSYQYLFYLSTKRAPSISLTQIYTHNRPPYHLKKTIIVLTYWRKCIDCNDNQNILEENNFLVIYPRISGSKQMLLICYNGSNSCKIFAILLNSEYSDSFFQYIYRRLVHYTEID